MQLFSKFTIIYLLFTLVLVAGLRPDAGRILFDMAASIPYVMTTFLSSGRWSILLLAATLFFIPRQILLARLPTAILMLAMSSAFFLCFTLVKTTLPLIVPYWADPMLAAADRAVHFGADPWRLTNALLPDWPSAWFEGYYLGLWMLPAQHFPALLALFDDNRERIRTYLILYLWSWVGIGNVFAALFMSVGPVYHDRLLGGSQFAGLADALDTGGITGGSIGMAQDYLWSLHLSGLQAAGSGISAFPSVHLAVATVLALYVVDRFRWTLVPMILLVAGYEVLSVHLGWHYAIDGYFSIATVLGVRAWLARRSGVLRTAAQDTLA